MDEFEKDVIERLTRIEGHTALLTDHETRIRRVETKQSVLTGALTLMAPVLGWLGLHITLH